MKHSFYSICTLNFCLLILFTSCENSLFDQSQKHNDDYFVLVIGGMFQKGFDPVYSSTNNYPIDTIKSFLLGKYEVTFENYIEFLNDVYEFSDTMKYEDYSYIYSNYFNYLSTPWIQFDDNNFFFQADSIVTSDKCPVFNVSWNGAQTYCIWKGGRLPTELEWEYAAQGGKKSKGYSFSGSNDLNDVGWYQFNSNSVPHPVGLKNPNELGLYDMSGNVYEWTSDDICHQVCERHKIYKGGAFNKYMDHCRPTFKEASLINSYDELNKIGFRVVKDL